MRSASRIPGVVLLLLCVTHSSATSEDPPATPTCDRFTLEKVRLGMSRSEVEALSLGEIAVVGETTDSLRLQVAGPGRKLQVGLAHDRVQVVEMVASPDKKRAATTLDDLRARWGEPEKKETTSAPKKRSAYERPGEVLQSFKWSDRTCRAYGLYHYSGGGLYVALATSTDSIRKFIEY